MSKAYQLLHNFISQRLSTPLRQKVWQWLIAPPHQEEKDEALRKVWNEYPLEADESTSRSFQKVRKKIVAVEKKEQTHLFFRKWGYIAAIMAIPLLSIAASFLYIHSYNWETNLIECLVPMGEQKKIKLPDGSDVCLNSGTLLIYPEKFKGEKRSVYLIGEANFSVSRDEKHPFIVKTGLLNIKVLGTKFNVQAYAESEKTITTLEHGSVSVNKQNQETQTIPLAPNEQLEYNRHTGVFKKNKIDASLYAGWTKGELNFIRQTFKEILTVLQREHDIHFIINPRLLTPDLYTIKFRQNENLDEILNIITKTVGNIAYEREDNIITIYSRTKKGG